jgi:hypothetical protein
MSNHTPVPAIAAGLPSATDAQTQTQTQTQTLTPLQPDIVSEIYEQSVPGFASLALDRLQGSLYASPRFLQISEPDEVSPHTWVGFYHGEIVGVLLFRTQGRAVMVLSEVVTLACWQIDAFAESVFRYFPDVRQIKFNAVSISSPPSAYPHQCFAFSENYVLTLPPTQEAYLSALGKSTRQSLRGYGNRLQRDFPDFRWVAFSHDAMSTEDQRTLLLTLQRFKRESMAVRGKQADIDSIETERLLVMASECGLFGVGTIGDRICAGAMSCRVGDTYVMLISASDPAMSTYRLGLLACLWAVSDCIARGGRSCHLLWGRYQYKHQLRAVPLTLSRIIVYPSRVQMLLQPHAVLAMSIRGVGVHIMAGIRRHLSDQNNAGAQQLLAMLRLCKRAISKLRDRWGLLRRLVPLAYRTTR